MLKTILPIIEGFGYAIIEVVTQARLGWVKPIWDLSIPYLIGMFIVLSIPWLLMRDVFYWIYATALAYLSEDVSYWLLVWRIPYSWAWFYPVIHGFPLDYLIAIAIIITYHTYCRKRL